jgi:TRAP transporter TAXI family solute receptor
MSHVKTVLAAVLVSVMALSAPVGVQAKTKLTLGTASMGGNYFNMGAAIAKVFNDKATGYTLTAQATGGSAFNLTAIEDKELDFGISQGPAVMSAIAAQTVPSLRTVANYNGTPQHVLVRTDAGIKSLKDLKGKRIELIAAGDGVEVCSRKVVESIGLNWDDVKHEYSGNRVQASSRLKTGQVDAIIDGTGVGAAWISDILKSGKFHLLAMTQEEMEQIMKANPEFSAMPIPANSYGGQDATIPTVGNWTIITCSADLPEEVVYNLTKIFHTEKDKLKAAHAFFKDIAPANIKGAVIAPLHPGAEKFYKEAGVL